MPAKQTERTSGKVEEEAGNSLLIVAVSIGVLAILLLAYCIRMLYIHINVEQFKLEALKAQAERNKKAETEFGKIEG